MPILLEYRDKRQCTAQVQTVDSRIFVRLEFYDASGKPAPSGAFMLLPEIWEWFEGILLEKFDLDVIEVGGEE
jgi:hypothetical protein